MPDLDALFTGGVWRASLCCSSPRPCAAAVLPPTHEHHGRGLLAPLQAGGLSLLGRPCMLPMHLLLRVLNLAL